MGRGADAYGGVLTGRSPADRVAGCILGGLVYGFFGTALLLPLVVIVDEMVVRRKFEVAPVMMVVYAGGAALYLLVVRASGRSIRRCRALADELGLQFTWSRGYLPGIMYWPAFAGEYRGRRVRIWFRGRRTTGLAMALAPQAKIAVFEVDGYAMSGRDLTAVIPGVPGQPSTNEAIRRTLESMAATAEKIEGSV